MLPLDLTNSSQIACGICKAIAGLPLYDWALILYLPSGILNTIFDFRDRSVPLIVNIPAAAGAGLLLYLIGTNQMAAIDPWIAVLLVIAMIAIGLTGLILVKKNLTGLEDVICLVLYSATFGSVFIIVVSGIITFIHVIYRRFMKLTTWRYERYSFYPYPICGYLFIAYVIWLVSIWL